MSHRFLKKTRKVSLVVLKKNKNREYKYLNYLKNLSYSWYLKQSRASDS